MEGYSYKHSWVLLAIDYFDAGGDSSRSIWGKTELRFCILMDVVPHIAEESKCIDAAHRQDGEA